ncbi:MAG: hypothetical protein R3Y15_02095 [Rikenellaceae bacterium]
MDGRMNKSIRNFNYGLLSQFVNLILGFFVRAVFIRCLGIEYLGVNGLFTNVLTVLSLAELGVGTAMVYSMYKPLAYDDQDKLKALMNLYKRLYTYIGCVVGVVGLLIIPLFPYILKDASGVSNLIVIYLLFLANSVFSYFYVYKRSILQADQKIYIYSKFHLWFLVGKTIMQIVLLYALPDFLIYLAIQVVFTFAENVYISKYVDRLYPYLKGKNDSRLDKSDLDRIKKDVSALVLSNIARVALNGTANIIISAVVGIAAVGLYSNYTLITGALIMVLGQISSSITASVGNYIAKEASEDQYKLFERIDLLNFWLYSFCAVTFVVASKPFISMWIGEDYVLAPYVVGVIAVNFILEGMLQSLWTFRTTMGLFVQGKYRPVVAAILNIISAYLLGKEFGLVGVLLGTTVSRLCVNMWYDPYIILKHGFGFTAWKYIARTALRLTVMVATMYFLQVFVRDTLMAQMSDIVQLVLIAATSLVFTNLVLLVMERRNSELGYYIDMVRSVLSSRLSVFRKR